MLDAKVLGTVLTKSAELTNEGFFVVDPETEGRPIIYVNRGFEEMTGYTKEELLGKNTRILVGEDTKDMAVRSIQHAVDNKTQCVMEVKVYRKDKIPFWGRMTVSPTYDEKGTPYVVGILSDITYLVQTESRLKEMELEGKLDEVRIGVLRTVMRTVNDIVGNSLNSMQIVTFEYQKNGSLSDETLEKFDQIIFNVMKKLQHLSNIKEYKTTNYGGEVFDLGQTKGEKG